MENFAWLWVPLVMLLIGDALSTFIYHVPEHAFGKFHSLVHHSANRSFFHYAVLNRNPLVLLDGIAGALPYVIFTPWFWELSPVGTVIGLAFGEFHVIWRHISVLEWQTPNLVKFVCRFLFITTPEIHDQHHKDARIAFGDIFTFYDKPAQMWLKYLVNFKKSWKNV